MKKKIMKVIKRIAIAVFILLIAFFLIRAIGREIYNQTPDGGINESRATHVQYIMTISNLSPAVLC